MGRPRPARRRGTWPGRRALGAALVAVVASCGGETDAPAARDRAGVETVDADGAPPAVYQTSLTFLGFSPNPAILLVHFENRTTSDRVRLRYRGWLAGPDRWTPVLSVDDSVPVARAAWRILPAGPLRLGVEDGGELSNLRIALPAGGELRIDALEEFSTWSGITGRRESLRAADLQAGGRVESGWLLQRRRARLLDEQSAPRELQTLLLADTLGNGLLILRDRTLPDVPATAWAWIDGIRLEWADAILLDLPGASGGPGSWSFELRDVGLFGEITAEDPALAGPDAEGAAIRARRVRASLAIGDERRVLRGVLVEEREP
ncbi:MAG: hypothetical protein RRA92_03605 [Gemmatimonadota bacterium]|nr:hypothetical protein [Gemmatimonadota bacterium]